MKFVFEQMRVGGDRNFGYLVGDREAGSAVLVDPSFRPKKLVERARVQDLEVTHIINTHGHRDHTNGNLKASKLTVTADRPSGAPVLAHRSAASHPDIPVDHGDKLLVGDFALEFLHTPGHADDHLCVLVESEAVCMTGDTLFVGKVGGTSSLTAAQEEYRSLQEVLLRLDDETTIWPGHDYGCRPASTIGLEKRTNPFLLCDGLDEFLELKAGWAEFKRQRGLV